MFLIETNINVCDLLVVEYKSARYGRDSNNDPDAGNTNIVTKPVFFSLTK